MEKRAGELNCFVHDSITLKPAGSGRLDGKTFVVKDLISVAGHTSSFGHPKWRETHEPASTTAPVVMRMLKNGAGMVGLVKMDQLAYSLIGNVGEDIAPLNARYPDRFTGGSSSGPASAVAGGAADIGIGTDTAGSIRVPSAACGIFGLRPTHASISTDGVIPLAQSFDTVGVMSRSAATLRDAVLAITDLPARDREKKGRVLIPEQDSLAVSASTKVMIERVGDAISSLLDAPLETAGLETLYEKGVGDLFARIQGREIWTNHSEWVGRNGEYLADDVRVRLDRCRQSSLATREARNADENARRAYRDSLDSLMGGQNVIVLPVISDLMVMRDSTLDLQREFRLTVFNFMAPASLAGLPEVVVPVRDETGIDRGVGILGARGADRMLLDIAVEMAGGKTHIKL